jgi:hypothetical protein
MNILTNIDMKKYIAYREMEKENTQLKKVVQFQVKEKKLNNGLRI